MPQAGAVKMSDTLCHPADGLGAAAPGPIGHGTIAHHTDHGLRPLAPTTAAHHTPIALGVPPYRRSTDRYTNRSDGATVRNLRRGTTADALDSLSASGVTALVEALINDKPARGHAYVEYKKVEGLRGGVQDPQDAVGRHCTITKK